MNPRDPVVVVGAGPVGLITALGLARQGVPVLLVEQEPTLTIDQRAGTFHPPTLEMLDTYGIAEAMHGLGIRVPVWQIRDRRSNALAEFDLALLADVTAYPYRFHLEQHRLTPIILDLLGKETNATTLFNHRFVSAEQDDEAVRVTIESDGRRDTIIARWLVGADGGRSAVRKAAGLDFEGFTWPEVFFGITTTHDFGNDGFALNSYISDPEEWVALFKMPGDAPPGVWRLAFPADPAMPEEEIAASEAIEQRLQSVAPQKAPYEVIFHSFYRVHQRVARDFRQGRIVLAGDAAHLNNPHGALGLNSGIHDAMNLVEKLAEVLHGCAGEELIDLYVRQRRTIAVDFVQASSMRNKRVLDERDPELRRQHFERLQRTAADPKLAREFLLDSSMISSVKRAAEVA